VVPKVDPEILFGSKGGEVIPNSLSLDKIGIEGDPPGGIGRQVCNGSELASKPLRILLQFHCLYLIGNLVDAIDKRCFIPSESFPSPCAICAISSFTPVVRWQKVFKGSG